MIVVISGGSGGGWQYQLPENVKIGYEFVVGTSKYRYIGDFQAIYIGEKS